MGTRKLDSQVTDGGQSYLLAKDDEVRENQNKLITELKKVNLHLSALSDMSLTDNDVEN